MIIMLIQPSEASLDAKYVGMGARFPGSQWFVGFVPVRKHTIKRKSETLNLDKTWQVCKMKSERKTGRWGVWEVNFIILVYRACSINQLLFSITFARHFSGKQISIQSFANLFQGSSVVKSKVSQCHPQYPRHVLPLRHTHSEAPPFLPQPKGYCSPPSQEQNEYVPIINKLLRNI